MRKPARSLAFNQFAKVIRWIHIYLSMAGFGVIVFFSVTGITLNHPAWFGVGESVSRDFEGELDRVWLRHDGQTIAEDVDRLAIAESLRERHRLSGTVADFRVDDSECAVTWKGPGYAADAVIDRASGHYQLATTSHGFVALINDLHKGRDSGPGWSVLIDVTAILMTVSSLTGLALLLLLRRKRVLGVLIAFAGTAAACAVYLQYVPR